MNVMKLKIFHNSKKSRIKSDLKFRQWDHWLRSAYCDDIYTIGYVNYYGLVSSLDINYSFCILPACTI